MSKGQLLRECVYPLEEVPMPHLLPSWLFYDDNTVSQSRKVTLGQETQTYDFQQDKLP